MLGRPSLLTVALILAAGIDAAVAPKPAWAVVCSNGGTGTDPAGDDGNEAGNTACGEGATAGGGGSFNTAVGNNANATGADGTNTATGDNADAHGISGSNTASGSFANASGDSSGNVATGSDADANGANSSNIATGAAANAAGLGSTNIAIGANATASGDQTSNMAIGTGATASGNTAVAVGTGATATHANAAAFGNGAATTRANQQVLGTASNTYTLSGLASAASKAAQSGATYFVTSDALGNLATSDVSVETLIRRTDKALTGVAMAFAMAGVPTLLPTEIFAMSANWGTFEGENGLALNATLRLAANVQLNGGVAYGLNEDLAGGRAGVRVGW